MMWDYIEYNGRLFPTRIVTVDDVDYVFAPCAAWDELSTTDSEPKDNQARHIDESIFYYCEFDELYGDEARLIQLIFEGKSNG
jgi:hypothetical protein